MKRLNSLLFLVFGFACLAFGQASNCAWTDTFTSATAGPVHVNKPTTTGGTPCMAWIVSYWTTGATGVQVQIEGSAVDSSGAPTGGFTALTIQTGITGNANPALGTTAGFIVACCDVFPAIRINPTTFTGTAQKMTVRVYGYVNTLAAKGTGGGGGVVGGSCAAGTFADAVAAITAAPTCAAVIASTSNLIAGNGAGLGSDSGLTAKLNMTALGDTIYGGAAGAPAVLPGNITTVPKVLTQVGDGANSAAPSWQLPPSAGTLTFYMTPTASTLTNGSAIVNTDNQLTVSPFSPKTNVDIAHNAAGDVVLQSWATNAGFPGITFIPAGIYTFHIHAERLSGNRAVTLYGVFREVSSTGTPIGTIGTQTESSEVLTGAEVEFPLQMADGNTYTLASAASRIVLDVHAVFVGGTTNTTVRLFVGGTADSHISLPSNTVDVTSFVPYTGATGNVDLGAHSYLSTNGANVRAFGASFDGAGSALTAGKTVYFTVPYGCTIAAWNIAVDTGTATIDIWRKGSGTAIPTVTDTITAAAVPAIAANTAIHSTTTTGWCGTGTCAVTANDIFGINLKVVASATFANLVVQCNQ